MSKDTLPTGNFKVSVGDEILHDKTKSGLQITKSNIEEFMEKLNIHIGKINI